MSTFEQLSKMPGVGALFYFDVSVDKGATYTKAYSTQWYFGGSYQTEARIVSLGNLTRRLGADRGFTAATIDCVLENTDGGVDWVCDQSTFAAQAMGSVWKLHCILYDPANPSDLAGMVCGVFSLMDPPTRNASTVSLKLVDGGLGIVSQMAATPTIRDWVNVTDADRPAYLTATNIDDIAIIGSVPNYDFDAPTPLMFGNNQFQVSRCFQNCYVLCAVPGDAGVLPTTLDFVRTNTGLSIPQQLSGPGLSTPLNVWTVHRSATITKNGKDWHLLWLDLDLNNDANLVSGPGTGDDSLTRNFLCQFYELEDADKLFRRYGIHELIGPITVQGGLMSHPADDLTYRGTPALTIVQDLLTYCLPTAITVETDTSASVTRAMTWASGSIVQGVQEATSTGGARFMELTDGDMPKALRQICAVGDFDLFFTWAGNARVAVMAEDYESQTETIATLPEEMMAEVSERVPSVGERNAPVNRTFVNVGGTRYGPIDDAAAIAEWGRVVSREVDGTWLPDAPVLMNDGERGVWVPRPRIDRFKVNGQSVIRPVLSVVTGLNGLNFELADYIKVTWTRGTIGGPYVDAIFRVEGIALAPLDGKVQLELVWCDDLRAPGSLPYILDDEDEALVVAASGGRTCTLTDGSITVEFSSGDLSADGVALGDVLVVRDATESATAFKRNRTLIIVNIIDADTLEVDVTDFGSGGPFTISDWKIVHGPDTNPRPDYYGSTCTVLGQFYNLGEANRLLDG